MWESNYGGDPVCKTRNELLGTVKTFARTAIIHNKDGENSPVMINNPARKENIFNKLFYKEELLTRVINEEKKTKVCVSGQRKTPYI